jgi:hypothetical protein
MTLVCLFGGKRRISRIPCKFKLQILLGLRRSKLWLVRRLGLVCRCEGFSVGEEIVELRGLGICREG